MHIHALLPNFFTVMLLPLDVRLEFPSNPKMVSWLQDKDNFLHGIIIMNYHISLYSINSNIIIVLCVYVYYIVSPDVCSLPMYVDGANVIDLDPVTGGVAWLECDYGKVFLDGSRLAMLYCDGVQWISPFSDVACQC